MVTDFFGTLLQELSRAVQIPGLKPDANNSCLIRFRKQNDIRIQIELDSAGLMVVIGTDLGSVAPGRYRENIFTEALKANGLPSPRYGTFAYSRKTDHLLLFEKLPIRDLTGDKVADYLKLFIEKAKVWQEALARNEVPVVITAHTSRPMNIFGMRP
jgi:hypothetical protein